MDPIYLQADLGISALGLSFWTNGLLFDMAATKGSLKWMPDALRGRKWGVLCSASSMLSVDVALVRT
jgi:hypothetical protein